ncbi:MAG: hypothetical protein PHS92_00320 [Candidatus Gracilibacteria bacterium]|nr:hypothetical protein [Candidatus Gracilibacteria bacterium]
MILKIYGNNEDTQKLFDITVESLDELGLSEFIKIEKIFDEKYKEELAITAEPAFCIEEESIELKDVIFEGFVPEKDEIMGMIMSMVGGEDDGCGGSCDGCGHGGSCHI